MVMVPPQGITTPVSSAVVMAIAGPRKKSFAVGGSRHEILLHEHLHPIGQGLKDAEGPGAIRADAVLHEGRHLALAIGLVGRHAERDQRAGQRGR